MAYKCKIFKAVNTSYGLVFCICTHVCTISEDIVINKGKEICVPSMESISGQRCERRNMVARCEFFSELQ